MPQLRRLTLHSLCLLPIRGNQRIQNSAVGTAGVRRPSLTSSPTRTVPVLLRCLHQHLWYFSQNCRPPPLVLCVAACQRHITRCWMLTTVCSCKRRFTRLWTLAVCSNLAVVVVGTRIQSTVWRAFDDWIVFMYCYREARWRRNLTRSIRRGYTSNLWIWAAYNDNVATGRRRIARCLINRKGLG